MKAIKLVSPLPPDECVARIAAAIDPEGVYPIPGTRPVVGRIAGHRVRLRKRLPDLNSFQTTLLGSLEPHGEGTVFRGRIGLHPGAIGCMAVFFVVVILLSAWLSISMARGGAGGGPGWAVVVPLLAAANGVIIVVIGAGVIWLGRVMARGEDRFLLDFVAEVIDAQEEPPAAPDPAGI